MMNILAILMQSNMPCDTCDCQAVDFIRMEESNKSLSLTYFQDILPVAVAQSGTLSNRLPAFDPFFY